MRKYIFALVITLLLVGCKTTSEPTIIERVKTDTLRVYSHSTDSIYLHDSICTVIKGDTVTTDRWHTLIKYIERHDTLYSSRVDSIPVPYEVIKKEQYIPKYMKVLSVVGIVSILLVVFFIINKVKVL